MKYLLLAFLSLNAFADTSRDVFIRGKIGNEFDDSRVKVIDTEGQSYYLSRHLFPKELVIKQGQTFAIEVHEKELDKVKLLKK
jgi:hypothetical protein